MSSLCNVSVQGRLLYREFSSERRHEAKSRVTSRPDLAGKAESAVASR
jgi:hypothetical protein